MEEKYLLTKSEIDDIRKVLFILEREYKRDNIQKRNHQIERHLLSRSLCAIGESDRASFLDIEFVKSEGTA